MSRLNLLLSKLRPGRSLAIRLRLYMSRPRHTPYACRGLTEPSTVLEGHLSSGRPAVILTAKAPTYRVSFPGVPSPRRVVRGASRSRALPGAHCRLDGPGTGRVCHRNRSRRWQCNSTQNKLQVEIFRKTEGRLFLPDSLTYYNRSDPHCRGFWQRTGSGSESTARTSCAESFKIGRGKPFESAR